MEKNNTLVAIGANCVDEYYELKDKPIIGDKTIIKYLEKNVGGMIGNAASVYANYNNKTYMFDYLVLDENTELIIDTLKSHKIITDYIVVEKDIVGSKCLVLLYQGERIVLVQENQKNNIVFTKDQIKVLKESKFVYTTISDIKRIKDYDYVLNDIKNSTKIVLDIEANTITNFEEDFKIIQKANYLFINESGYNFLMEKTNQTFINDIRKKVDIIVVTLGASGCLVYDMNNEYKIDGIKTNVIDTTGAGDTFNASFLHGLSKGWELRKVAIFANGAAARSIQFRGPKSGVVDEMEVIKFLKENNILFD